MEKIGRKISHFQHEYEFKMDRVLEIPEDVRVKAVERGISGEELESFMVRIRHRIADAEAANSVDVPYGLVDTADGTVGCSGVVIDFCGFCADLVFAAYDVIGENLFDGHDDFPDDEPSSN